MLGSFRKARSYEFFIWIISAALTGFGLGAMFDGFISDYSVIIFLVGVVIHTWIMIKVYLRD